LVDLARQMVELSGCTVRDSQKPDGDITITFTGLRPGEKLYEELLLSDADQATRHRLIRKANERYLGNAILKVLLSQLNQCLEEWDSKRAVDVLKELVPEFSARQEDFAFEKPSPALSSFEHSDPAARSSPALPVMENPYLAN